MNKQAGLGALGAVGAGFAAYKTFFPWLDLDLKELTMAKYGIGLFKEAVDSHMFLVDKFEHFATTTPDQYFIIYNDVVFTYRDVDIKANKVARALRNLGFNKGDMIAMFMTNEPAFIWTFLGALKLGLAVSLINYNLRQQSLLHCLDVCKAKTVICSSDPDVVSAIAEVAPNINITAYIHDISQNAVPELCRSFADEMAAVPGDRVNKSWRSPTELMDPLCFVFTSGTTGTPKPALLTQVRGQSIMQAYKTVPKLTSQDILYTCLPLYHSSALFLGLMGVINVGATIVVSRKFSATHFWEDCRKHKVTGFQYIGELCRYLLVKPPDPKDGKHCIRFAYGNGLRIDIWKEFQERFKVPQIFEFFAATEAAGSLMNIHNKAGAVGRYSPFVAWLDNNSKLLVRFDMVTAQPIRNAKGRCIPVKRGEAGLFLVRFPPHIRPDTMYLGSPEKAREKIVRDALEKGDVFYNYGDLLCQDKDYFLYFVDRIGDTFRWKGENVSTLEVANTLTGLDFITDANVYGVHVPGNDGRAGMACLTLTGGQTDLTDAMRTALFQYCEEGLPKYARPLFLRVQGQMEVTVTWKQRKVELVKEGFNVEKIVDPLYFLDNQTRSYLPLKQSDFLRFSAGHSKL